MNQQFPEYKLAKLSDLAPYARNARTHSREQIEQIAASIREFGFTAPILIDRDGVVVSGHGRLEAARMLGMESVPTIELAHLSESQRRAYVLADNKLALNSGWDDALLESELRLLDDSALELTGFSADDLSALADVGKLSFDDAPESVEENAKKIAEMRAYRKQANENVADKNDTEKYLVIVFPNRGAKERKLALMGLPVDERYLDSASVELRLRFSSGEACVISARKTKTAPKHKAGAGG